jgi:hypothetical protein
VPPGSPLSGNQQRGLTDSVTLSVHTPKASPRASRFESVTCSLTSDLCSLSAAFAGSILVRDATRPSSRDLGDQSNKEDPSPRMQLERR